MKRIWKKRRKSHKSSRFHGLLVISSGYKVISISCEGGAAGRDWWCTKGKGKVDRGAANHSLSSTASQVTSNIPIPCFLVLGCNRQARRIMKKSIDGWRYHLRAVTVEKLVNKRANETSYEGSSLEMEFMAVSLGLEEVHGKPRLCSYNTWSLIRIELSLSLTFDWAQQRIQLRIVSFKPLLDFFSLEHYLEISAAFL